MRKIISVIVSLCFVLTILNPAFVSADSTTVSIPVKTNIGNIVEITGDSNLPEQPKVFVEGEYIFNISYSTPGEYKYKIKQATDTEGIIVDTKVYDIEVFVFQENNKLNSYVSAVIEGNKTKEFSIEFNNQIKVSKKPVKFLKVSADTNEPLKGAEFELFRDTEKIAEWTSDTEAYRIDLNHGTYTVKEKKAPDKYEKIKDFTFEVLENGIVVGDSNDIMLHEDIILIKNTKINEPEPIPNPSIETTLVDKNAEKTILVSNETILVDTVTYKDLDPTKSYIFVGKLIDKETGNPLIENGKEVIASSGPFIPAAKDGSQEVEFKVNSSNLAGKSLVAFEAAYEIENTDNIEETSKNIDEIINKKIVATHEDISDPAQTVQLIDKDTPTISTTLTDNEGNKKITETNQVILVDKVEYKNLDTNKNYVLHCVLMDKATGDPLEISEGSVYSGIFKPEKSDGIENVSSIYDLRGLGGTDIVAFETLYEVTGYTDEELKTIDVHMDDLSKKVVAEHKDINDEGQTISIESTDKDTPIAKTVKKVVDKVKTGDSTAILLYVILLIAAIIGIVVAIIINKRNKNKKE